MHEGCGESRQPALERARPAHALSPVLQRAARAMRCCAALAPWRHAPPHLLVHDVDTDRHHALEGVLQLQVAQAGGLLGLGGRGGLCLLLRLLLLLARRGRCCIDLHGVIRSAAGRGGEARAKTAARSSLSCG